MEYINFVAIAMKYIYRIGDISKAIKKVAGRKAPPRTTHISEWSE